MVFVVIVLTSGLTPLHYAASAGKIDCVIFLLREGAKINAQSVGGNFNNSQMFTQGLTPLAQAASSGYSSVVLYLLEKGADPSIADFTGRTSLHWARHYHQYNCAKVLEEFLSKSLKTSDISTLDEDLENQCSPAPSLSTFSDWRTLPPSKYTTSEVGTLEGKRIFYKYENKKHTLPVSMHVPQRDSSLSALFKALENCETTTKTTTKDKEETQSVVWN